MVNFYSRTECFHKGSCLGWNEVLILPGQLNEPFREVPALCWALELPPAHGMLLSHVCGFHNPGPSLPAGNCVKESWVWPSLERPPGSSSPTGASASYCLSRENVYPETWGSPSFRQRAPGPGGAAPSYYGAPTEPGWVVLWPHNGHPPAWVGLGMWGLPQAVRVGNSPGTPRQGQHLLRPRAWQQRELALFGFIFFPKSHLGNMWIRTHSPPGVQGASEGTDTDH